MGEESNPVDALINMIIGTYHTTRLADTPAATHIRNRLGDRLTRAIQNASGNQP